MEKIKRNITHWGTIWLNLAGKVVLIKAVLNSFLLYQCTLLLAPVTVLSKIEGLIRNFLWQGGNNGGSKKFALVSWKTIKLPWSEGGLQIRDLKSQNLAMGAKLLWNLLESNSSWSNRVLKKKYFPGPTLRCLDGDHVVKNGSVIYNVCKKTLPYFRTALSFIPGNGKSISIWQDAILGRPPPHLPRLQDWMTANSLTTIWDIAEWEDEEPYNWSRWALPECPAELKTESTLLLHHLAGLAPINKIRKDKRCWGRQFGKYTTAEGYQHFTANYNVPANPRIWNNLWKHSTLPKIDLFSWTLIHKKILTGENMEKRGFAGPFRCPLCAVDSENISHLFFKCSFAAAVWNEVLNGNNAQ